MRKIISILVATLLSSLLCGSALAAGQKKLNKCRAITESGSYAVTKDLQATAKTNGNCITIEADFVTLDLNGFTLRGDGTGYGVSDNGTARQAVVVRNGMITGFLYGIDLGVSTDCTIEKVTAIDNGQAIEVGERSLVTGNIASAGNYGIEAGARSTVTGNVAHDNANYGVIARLGSTVSGNSTTAGFGSAMFLDCPCNVIGNTYDGLAYTGTGCQFLDNLAL